MALYLFRKIVFNCEQATFLMVKKTEQKLSVKERLKLFYHLLFCDPCKRFKLQTQIIDKSLHDCHEHLSHHPSEMLSTESKEKIQRTIDSISQ